LPKGLENAFLATLGNAQRSTDEGRTGVAVNQLQAFINKVEAQRGKVVTNAVADALIASAGNIVASMQTD
jgi:hypothetical protein